MKADIRSLGFDEIKEYLVSNGDKAFRAKQIWHWLWQKGVTGFDKMANLPESTRKLLTDAFSFHVAEIVQKQVSADSTTKLAFSLFDDSVIEGVLIPSGDRMTACISSQVGCMLGCSFCATAKLNFHRNLEVGEIFDQVVSIDKLARETHGIGLANIVLMGMGEPLLNYDNVLAAIARITATDGLGMSPSRITLSTAGVHEMIKRLADDGVRFNLAVSLHSAVADIRDKLMPINRKRSGLTDLSQAIKYFNEKTGTRVTIEYLLLGGVNDSTEDAAALALWCRSFPCKVNLIEYNPIGDGVFKKSQKANDFKAFLEQKNMIVNLRASKGKDIDAACGQLANKNKEKK